MTDYPTGMENHKDLANLTILLLTDNEQKLFHFE